MIRLPSLTEIGAVPVRDTASHEPLLNAFLTGWTAAHELRCGRRQPVFAWIDDSDETDIRIRLAAATELMEKYG